VEVVEGKNGREAMCVVRWVRGCVVQDTGTRKAQHMIDYMARMAVSFANGKLFFRCSFGGERAEGRQEAETRVDYNLQRRSGRQADPIESWGGRGVLCRSPSCRGSQWAWARHLEECCQAITCIQAVIAAAQSQRRGRQA